MAKLVKFFCISILFLLLTAVAATAQKPIITPSIIDLGSVGTPTTVVATFHNTTNNALVITKIEADCHCTTTSYSRRPIAAADSTEIKVTYTPKRDNGVFYKAVNVYTTASKEPIKFIIRGTNIYK